MLNNLYDNTKITINYYNCDRLPLDYIRLFFQLLLNHMLRFMNLRLLESFQLSLHQTLVNLQLIVI